MELNQLTIHELKEKLLSREITSVDIVESVFNRIDQVEGKVHAYISLLREDALRGAAGADQKIQEGAGGELCGIPVALKDILCTKGVKTTCGSRILQNFIPPYDATVVEALRRAGAVFVGKANMDEFAMGSSTETSYFGVTRNPWALDRIPGGSSGGSAAAVAADECIASLGSDTGGSIRQPAALCGVVGMKPTYGRVSRFGLIAFASSLDQIGPFTKDVEDCAIMMNVIAGYDPKDSTSVPQDVPDYRAFLNRDIAGWTVGIPREYFRDGMDPEVSAAVKKAIAVVEDQGARCIDISLPHTDYCVAVYYIVAPAEASSNLARYDGVKYGYRAENCRDLLDMYKKNPFRGVRSGSETPHHAGNLRPLFRVLRRLLQESLSGQGPDQGGFRRGLQTVRRHPDADVADAGLQNRGKDGRSSPDVSVRYIYHIRQPGRHSGHFRSLRLQRTGAACRSSVSGGAFRRGKAPADCPQL